MADLSSHIPTSQPPLQLVHEPRTLVIEDDPPPTSSSERDDYARLLQTLSSPYGYQTPDVYSAQNDENSLLFSRGVPVPIYRSRNWLGAFGDEYLTKTSYDEGSPYFETDLSALSHWLFCFDEVRRSHPTWISHSIDMPDSSTDPRCDVLRSILSDAAETSLDLKRTVQDSADLAGGLCRYVVDRWIPKLMALRPGDMACFLGGWAAIPIGHALWMTILRVTNDTFSLIVTNSGAGLEWYSESVEITCPLVRTAAVDGRIDEIPTEKMFRAATWLLIFHLKLHPSRDHCARTLYDVILPLFIPDPVIDDEEEEGEGEGEQETSTRPMCVAQAFREARRNDPVAMFRRPQLSGTCFFKAVVYGPMYVMRLLGFTEQHAQTVHFAIKRQMIFFARDDLALQMVLTPSEKRLIRIGMEQVAIDAKKQDENDRVTVEDCREIKECFGEIESLLESREVLGLSVPRKIQRKIGGKVIALTSSLPVPVPSITLSEKPFPLFDCFLDSKRWNLTERRFPIANDLSFPDNVAMIDPLMIKVNSLEDFITLLKCSTEICDHVFELITDEVVRHAHLIAIIERVFLELLPIPRPMDHSHGDSSCFYSDLCYTRDEQLEVLKLIRDLSDRYRLSCLILHALRPSSLAEVLGERFLVFGVVLAVTDTIVRMAPRASPDVLPEPEFAAVSSVLSEFYTDSRSVGGDAGSTSFEEYCRYVVVRNARAAIVRERLIEYFFYQKQRVLLSRSSRPRSRDRAAFLAFGPDGWIQSESCTFRVVRRVLQRHDIFELEMFQFERSDLEVLARYLFCDRYLSTDLGEIAPELLYLRDARVSLAYAYQSSRFVGDLPGAGQLEGASPRWTYAWHTMSRRRDSKKIQLTFQFAHLDVTLNPNPLLRNLASPKVFVLDRLNADVVTENDVLYNQRLVSLDASMPVEDSERLFSFLTAPFLRIPLILHFFAQTDRINLLLSVNVQKFLWHVLFLPEAWSPRVVPHPDESYVPETDPLAQVPLESVSLGTPQGLLRNEMVRSPKSLMEPFLKILSFALHRLAASAHKDIVANMILYCIRLSSRLMGMMTDLIEQGTLMDESRPGVRALNEYCRELEALLFTDATTILERLISASEDEERRSELFYHLALIHRHSLSKDQHCVKLLRGLFFVTLWRGYRSRAVEPGTEESDEEATTERVSTCIVPPCEFLRLVHDAIPSVIAKFRLSEPDLVSSILSDVLRGVGLHQSEENISFSAADDSFETFLSEDEQLVVRLPFCQCTFRRNHIEPLSDRISQNVDFKNVFGTAVRHASFLMKSRECSRYRVLGTNADHEVVYWNTLSALAIDGLESPWSFDSLNRLREGRELRMIEDCWSEYDPENIDPSLQWVATILEPVLAELFGARKERMKKNYVLYVPAQAEVDAEDRITLLCCQRLKISARFHRVAWKEFVVVRSPVRVEVFDLREYSRRIYRSLSYSSNSRLCLGNLPSRLDPRSSVWPEGCQFQAGGLRGKDALGLVDSVEIIRVFVPIPGEDETGVERLVGTKETHLPSRFLRGLLPACLARRFTFWLRHDGCLVGHPSRTLSESEALAYDYHLLVMIDETGLATVVRVSASGDRLKLVNLCRSNPLSDCLRRLENLSNVLCWALCDDSSLSSAFVVRIELPRLKLAFLPRMTPFGQVRLYNINNSGFFLSDRRTSAIEGLLSCLPHGVLLENDVREMFVLVPSYPLVLPTVDWQPLHTHSQHLRNNSSWLNQPLRAFVYPIHSSEGFLLMPSVNAQIYLIVSKMVHRDYVGAVKLLDAVSIDSVTSLSDRYLLSLFNHFESVWYPDALAAKLKVVLALRHLEKGSLSLQFGSELLKDYMCRAWHVRDSCKLSLAEILLLQPECEDFWRKMHTQLREGISGLVSYIPGEIPSDRGCGGYDVVERSALRHLRSTNARRWLADFSYVPPTKRQIEGEDCVSLLLRAWDDFPSGSKKHLGFSFLLDVLAGRVDLSVDGQTDDSFLLARAVAHMMYLRCTDQLQDLFSLESYSPDRCLTPFSILASLTRGRRVGCDAFPRPPPEPYEEGVVSAFVHPPLEDLTGCYRCLVPEEQDRKMVILRDGQVRMWKGEREMGGFRDDDVVVPSLDGFSFQTHMLVKGIIERANYPIILESGGEIIQIQIQTNVKRDWQRVSSLYPLNRFVFPDPPLENETFAGLWERGGIRGVSMSSSVPKVRWEVTLYLNHLVDTAEDLLVLAGFDPEESLDVIPPRTGNRIRVSPPAEIPFYLAEEFHPDYDLRMLCVGNVDEVGRLAAGSIETALSESSWVEVEVEERRVSVDLAFDVSDHHLSTTYSGQKIIHRLAEDKAIFANEHVEEYVMKNVDDAEALCELLRSLRDHLIRFSQAERKRSDIMLEQIVDRVNQVQISPDEERRSLLFENLKCAQETRILFSDLSSCVASSDYVDKIRSRYNPYPHSECIATLQVDVSLEMLRILRLGVCARALEAIDKCLITVLGGGSEKQLRNEARALAKLLTVNRQFFEPSSEPGVYVDPRFLCFEFANNIVLRDQQVSILRSFLGEDSISDHEGDEVDEEGEESLSRLEKDRNLFVEKDSMIWQMLMGQGKTTVIAPLLTLILSTSNDLVMHVVPSPLVEFTRSVLHTKFSSLIMKKVETMVFDRGSSLERIRRLRRKIVRCKNDRDILVSSPEAIKSLFLKYVELLDRSPLDPRVSELRQILKLWKESCTLLMDEVDLLLHPLRSELNFPIGEKQKLHLSPERWELPIMLLDAILSQTLGQVSVPALQRLDRVSSDLKDLHATIQRGISELAFLQTPHLILLDREFYDEVMLPSLIGIGIYWLESKGLFHVTTLEVVTSYLCREIGDDVEFLADLPPLHVLYLNLLYDCLRTFIPHVLSLVSRVKYGLLTEEEVRDMPARMPLSRARLAIPFVGKDVPSSSSEFAHPDVLISLTILAYLYEGLRLHDIRCVLTLLKRAFAQEKGPPSHRPSALLFHRWVVAAKKQRLVDDPSSSIRVNPLWLLILSDENQVEGVHRLLSRYPGIIYYYLENKIFPEEMTHHELKISASGQELGSDMLFRRRLGFSGTPNDLIPLSLGECRYQRGTDGKIIHTMCSADVFSIEVKSSDWTVESLLMDIASSGQYHALIDSGAVIQGMTNEEVVRFLLANGLSTLKGAVFLNTDDRAMVVLRGEDVPVPLNQCGIGPEERFTFYDHVHTTGIDIKQPLDSCAVQTISQESILRDISQGAWRMRGIGAGQTIVFYLLPEILHLAEKELALCSDTLFPHSLSKEESLLTKICAWLVLNNITRQNRQLGQLQLQNLDNVVRRVAFQDLLENSDNSEVRELAVEVFRLELDNSVSDCDPDPIPFRLYVEDWAERNEFYLTKKDAERARAIVRQIKHMSKVTTLVLDSKDAQQEQEREVEVDLEVQAEIEKEQIERGNDIRREEEDQRWNLVSLMYSMSQQRNDDEEEDGEEEHDDDDHPCFYPMSSFSLFGTTLQFPSFFAISDNFYRRHYEHDLFRHLKNVYMLLHWVPDVTTLSLKLKQLDPSEAERRHAQATKVFALHDTDEEGVLPSGLVKQILLDAGEIRAASDDSLSNDDEDHFVDLETFLRLIDKPELTILNGWNCVLLSLSEFESLRFQIQIGQVTHSTNGNVAIAIQILQGPIIAATPNFSSHVASLLEKSKIQTSVEQCLRFFDSNFHYSSLEILQLIEVFRTTEPMERKEFFHDLLLCRRRLNRKFDETPIAKFFRWKDSLSCLLHNAIRSRLSFEMISQGQTLVSCLGERSSGLYAVKEILDALPYLRDDIGLCDDDLLRFVEDLFGERQGQTMVRLESLQKFLNNKKKRDDDDIEEVMNQILLINDDVEEEPRSSGIDKVGHHYHDPLLLRSTVDHDALLRAAFFVDVSDHKTEVDPALAETIHEMFSETDPSDGYVFANDFADVEEEPWMLDSSSSVFNAYVEERWKDVVLASRIALVRSAMRSASYSSDVRMTIDAMSRLNVGQDKARKLILMADTIHSEAFSQIVSNRRVVTWAFQEEWGLDAEALLRIHAKKDAKVSLQDAVMEYMVKSVHEQFDED